MGLVMKCPLGGDSIRVKGGAGGTICVHGTVGDSFGKDRGTVFPTRGTTIRVRVVAGHVDPKTVDPNGAGNVETTTDSTTWCATGVTVPQLGDLTAVAWLRVLGSGSTITFVGATGSQFTGANDGTRDCCAETPCSSSSSSSSSQLAELADTPALEVTVPDGPNAGRYLAAPAGPQAWAVSVGGADCRLYLDTAARLVICRGSLLAPCAAFDVGPFSATFPGEVFGAAAEVVVTLA